MEDNHHVGREPDMTQDSNRLRVFQTMKSGARGPSSPVPRQGASQATPITRRDYALYAAYDTGALARCARNGQRFVRRDGELVIRRDAQPIRLPGRTRVESNAGTRLPTL